MPDKGYSDFREQLKSRNDIVSVISKYVHLEKRGRNFWACCPFHHERTPSFCVNEMEQFYHCFGCKESGDVIKFVMKYENLDYSEAIKVLAENAGMELPKYSDDQKYIELKKEKDRLFDILNLAKEHYKENIYLPQAKRAQEYIKLRGIGKRELEGFEIGYSLNWQEMVNYLLNKGKKAEDIVKAGIGEKDQQWNKLYDNLGERLIFPIVNANGDCVGFSARDITGTSKAKYKNTPGTIVFDKSKTVYGINLVKKQKQAVGIENIVIVEGQMDVIAMHKAGFRQTVACLGTALTFAHTKELRRFSENIVLCFDGDFAGIKASLRAIPILELAGLNVRVAVLPNGMDPDEYLKAYGAEKLQELLKAAVPATDFKILSVKMKYNQSNPAEKTKFVAEALAILRDLKTEAEKDIYLKMVKDISGVPLDVLRRDLNMQPAEDKPENIIPADAKTSGVDKAIAFILASMLRREEYANVKMDLTPLIGKQKQIDLYNIIKDKLASGENLHVSTVFDYFDVENEPEIKEVLNFNFEDIANKPQYFSECLWVLVENYLKNKQAVYTEKFKLATTQEERKEILVELNNITKKLKNKNLEDFDA